MLLFRQMRRTGWRDICFENRSDSVNIDNQNRLHPFIWCISDEGEVICDQFRLNKCLIKCVFCAKEKRSLSEVYKQFNKETRDGRDMSKIRLEGIIIEVKDSDIDSFLGGGQVSF